MRLQRSPGGTARACITVVRVIQSIPLLDEAAVAAMWQWKFEPALAHRRPVEV